jgi:hypothetical protein
MNSENQSGRGYQRGPGSRWVGEAAESMESVSSSSSASDGSALWRNFEFSGRCRRIAARCSGGYPAKES